MAAETFAFETEAQKLLKLMINSLYSTREVFLRELISNASDAIDKLRFEALSEPDLLGEDAELEIHIEFDEKTNTLIVCDNGVGMTREELVENLGTIAKSGTESFFSQLSGDEKSNANLIGQFGVGFYSAFLVADEISVISRRAGSGEAFKWISRGESEFTVEAAERERGTTVHLWLKEDATEFASGWKLRQIVRQYSDHIAVPVIMEGIGDDAEPETVNSATALWTRSRNDISDDEYKEFYKHISHDFEDPVLWSHNRVEGRIEYTSLVYIPKRAPFDLFQSNEPRGLKLYAQRVFIMDDVEAFLPFYLRWVKGVVDIGDFPLNMSRETIQENDQVKTIRNALTKRVVDLLLKYAEEKPEEYNELWSQFGKLIKTSYDYAEGFSETVPKLFRFSSTADLDTDQQTTSLESYVGRMAEDQHDIFYLLGESLTTIREHALLEVFKAKDLEVLLLTDDFDSYVMMHLPSFEGKNFRDVATQRDDLPKFDSVELAGDTREEVLKKVKEVLAEEVEAVVFSERLTDSASCLIRKTPWLSRGMRSVMEAANQLMPEGEKPTLELNRSHPLVNYLARIEDEERIENLAHILFEQASLAYGSLEVDASAYVRRVNQVLTDVLN